MAQPTRLGGYPTEAITLLAPGSLGLRAMTCDRVTVAPGDRWESAALAQEQVCYVTAGCGILVAAGDWAYELEQRSAFWLDAGVSLVLRGCGEGPLIVVRFRFRKRMEGVRVGAPRRFVHASVSPIEPEVGRTVRILFRGSEIGSASLVSAEESTYPPGGTSPVHRAAGMEEIFYVVSGWGRVRVGDGSFSVGPGDAVAIPDGALHNVEARPGGGLRHVTCNILL